MNQTQNHIMGRATLCKMKLFPRHKKEREALHCRSLHTLRLLRIALSVETSNAEPHADMYI